MKTMVAAGCDVIEIGLPYSDPVMDGPTIQAAAQQALEGGIRITDVLRTVEAVAATGVPTLVMTRSEEHTSELQSLMRISYAVFCLTKKNRTTKRITLTSLTHPHPLPSYT